MAETTMLKRSFRQVATIAGLIEKHLPGHEKTGRQMTINSDLVYDVLRQHQPDHLLLEATRHDAARGLTDIRRLSDLLTRFENRIDHHNLERISPLSIPLILEVGKENVSGSGVDEMLDELQQSLIDRSLQLDAFLPAKIETQQMSAHAIDGQFFDIACRFYADGSLYLPDNRTLILSDLHLGKGAAQRMTSPMPGYDTDDTLNRLEAGDNAHRPISDNPAW